MSNFSSDMDAIGTAVAAAVGGGCTYEIGWADPSRLSSEMLPKLYLFDPRSNDVQMRFAQSEVQSLYRGELWADLSLVQMATMRDQLREAIEADPTLGGTVVRARVLTTGIFEGLPNRADRRVVVVGFSTIRWEG